MKHINLLLYLTAWVVYIVFIFALFPLLNITVFNFSAPLVMFGGWLFLYRGALLSTAISIPCHYIMLQFHTDDPAIIAEAFNLFGISTQLFFSCCAAKIKTNHLRHVSLRESLEQDVEERTKDLRMLADHIVHIKTDERSKMSSTLLDAPQKTLKRMVNISALLEEHLHTIDHPKSEQAETISNLIGSCRSQLQSLRETPEAIAIDPSTFGNTLRSLSVHLHDFSGVNIAINSKGEWAQLDSTTLGHLYHIIHEALTNALKHAHATDIVIGIRKESDVYTVYIENNGTPMLGIARGGMGLPLMRYRASRIGASLDIDSGPEKNTVVRCTFSYNNVN